MSGASGSGNFFEDFTFGQVIEHATPRTVTTGDVALYQALYGPRFALQSSDEFARTLGFARAPVDDLIAFHIVFGKTVADISLNAVANLGYADGRFSARVYPGDTLSARSEVIGLKENSNRKAGVVWVRTTGRNQRDETVLSYVRWVMVRKRDEAVPAPPPAVPDLPTTAAVLQAPAGADFAGWDFALSGTRRCWGDYQAGERIDHVDGITIEEAEHMMATRLWQNTARVHFDQHAAAKGRFGRRLVYGGHVISLARALSYNGLANACLILAINGGSHANPIFAGDTIYAWSEVLERTELAGRPDAGALRLRTVAARNHPCAGFPLRSGDGGYDPAVVLDLDYTVLLPR
ncbi:MAG: MaoC family dehydratase [Alphaproteobacteria bacterium]|nr:MaoC family dehydratase [Alphaproteobacteria bacterium]